MSNIPMYRVEIIANVSLEIDLEEIILNLEKSLSISIYYSKLNNVHGRGSKGEKRGDGVWPEENFIIIIYTKSKILLDKLKEEISNLNKIYPTEGVNIFILEG